MSGKVIDVDFVEHKAIERSDTPPVAELLNDIADLADASATPIERVSPEQAAKLREMAEGARHVSAEVSKVQTAYDRVKQRGREVAAWVNRTRGNPISPMRRRFKP